MLEAGKRGGRGKWPVAALGVTLRIGFGITDQQAACFRQVWPVVEQGVLDQGGGQDKL